MPQIVGAEPDTPTIVGAEPDAPDYANMSWGDVGKRALTNAPSDFMNTSLGLAGMALNPGGTAAQTAVQLFTNPEARKEAWHNLSNYASWPGIKENIATHPVGTAVDVGTLLTPIKGEGVALRAAEAAGPKILSTAELKAGGGAAKNVARQSGVYFTDNFTKPLAQTLYGVAKETNIKPGRPGYGEITKILKDTGAQLMRPWSFNDLVSLQEDLSNAWKVAKKAGYDSAANTAIKLKQAVDEHVDALMSGKTQEGVFHTADITPDQAANLLKQGNAIYSKAKNAQTLERMSRVADIDAEQFSRSGYANTLRREVGKVLRADAKGIPTGLSRDHIKTLETFNKVPWNEWALKNARRFLKGPVGAVVGGTLGSGFGHLGTIAGAVLASGAGEYVAKKADTLAAQRFAKFISSVQQDGSAKLEELLGTAVHQHVMGTPRGQAAKANWVSKIGTKGLKGASKSLAIVISQSLKNASLAPRIEAELNKLAEQVQGSADAQADPEQQQ